MLKETALVQSRIFFGSKHDDELVGDSGANVIYGDHGSDTLEGGLGNDTLRGGAGVDMLLGGYGNDTYVFNSGDGGDVLYDYGTTTETSKTLKTEDEGTRTLDYYEIKTTTVLANSGSDTLAFGGEITPFNVIVDFDGQDLTLAVLDPNDPGSTFSTTTDWVYIKGWNDARTRIESFTFADGSKLDMSNVSIPTGKQLRLMELFAIVGTNDDDTLDGTEQGDIMYGLGGDDLLSGHNGDDEIYGEEGSDTLSGGAGNDLLDGGIGDDHLDGGIGADQMSGQAGDDSYIVDNAGDVVIEAAGEGDDHVFSSITRTLSENVERLTLTSGADINGTGNDLDNTLVGNSGNNVLDGATGADQMSGMAGDDTYIVDNVGDVVIEAAGEGDDHVYSSITYTLTENVERLTLTGDADLNGTGNDLDNTLVGNGGTNILDGATGADQMNGQAGDDSYMVDNAGDVVIEAAGEGDDHVTSSVTYSLSGNVEDMTLTGVADIDGTGNDLDNTLVGNSGNNVLDGATGVDQMSGQAGDDSYIVDIAGDVVIEAADQGDDHVFSSVIRTLSDNVERLTLTGDTDINGTGNALDNTLTGNVGNNLLDGATGADLMAGAAGDDTYIVDNAGDVVTEAATEGDDHIFSSVTYTLPENVEHLTLTGSADINGTGNGLDNTLTGNMGNNLLNGGDGADHMAGAAGDDEYIVDNVDDTVIEAFNSGIDTIYTSVSYVLPEHVENLVMTGSGDISAGGNGLDNHLTGNSGDNYIAGNEGNDTIEAGLGNDTLNGGQGNDTLRGGMGSDTYLINLGDGLDRIEETDSDNAIRFGEGLSLDNVALRITEVDGVYTAQVRMLNAGGCEQSDQGFDFMVLVNADDEITTPIDLFEFADGSSNSFDELLIKTKVTIGEKKQRSIITGREDDIIVAESGTTTVEAGSGNDFVYLHGAGGKNHDDKHDDRDDDKDHDDKHDDKDDDKDHDDKHDDRDDDKDHDHNKKGPVSVFGEGGDDYLHGGEGDDLLDGGCGTDTLIGENGKDVLTDTLGNNAFFGGAHDDLIEAGDGDDFIAGGRHNDIIQAGGGNNVIAYNKGGWQGYVFWPGEGAQNVLSAG